MRYNALALSAEDLKVGVDEALGQFLNDLGETTKVVAANVEAPGFESRVVAERPDHGRARLDRDHRRARPRDVEEGCPTPTRTRCSRSSRPARSLPAVLADLEKDTQYQVLMVQGPPELAKTLAEAYPGFDIVVGTSHVRPARRMPTSSMAARPCWSPSARRGSTSASSASSRIDAKPLRYQRVPLNRRYDGPAQPMKEIVEDEFRGMLKAAKVVENFPRHDYVNGARGRQFRRGRDVQVVPPQNVRQVGEHQARPGVRVARKRPPAGHHVRRRVRQLPHDRVRVHLGLEVGRADAVPEGEPVRELPRPRLEARRGPRRPGRPQVAAP